jgi:hypothetical protein
MQPYNGNAKLETSSNAMPCFLQSCLMRGTLPCSRTVQRASKTGAGRITHTCLLLAVHDDAGCAMRRGSIQTQPAAAGDSAPCHHANTFV